MNRTMYMLALAIFGGAAAVSPLERVKAAVIFADSFDRPDNRDIDAVTTGMTNNTGTVFGPSAVYSTPWVDPANQTTGPDGTANNGGGQQILSNEYRKDAVGTANLFVNHNFTNADILAAGGFTVSLDIKEIAQAPDASKGVAIAVGMSLTEAQSGHDGFDGTTNPATTVSKYTNAFQNTAFTTGAVLGDFYFGLRGDGSMAYGFGTPTGAAAPTIVTGLASTGTISAKFGVSSFNAGSTVSYEVFFNGISKGTGTFAWSGTNENYIGIDARDGVRARMDNFSVSTVPEPATVGLIASFVACVAGVRRRSRG
jgi:hypothetical protein